VIQAPTSEHRRLPVCLVVAIKLEDVELDLRPDVDERQSHARRFLGVTGHGRLEHIPVERMEPVAVVRQHRDMIDPVEQHVPSYPRTSLVSEQPVQNRRNGPAGSFTI
jgi:hypothetical protein